MRSPSLTRKTKHKNGRLVSTYEWSGRQVGVFDSARNGILVIELFQDEELRPDEKARLLILEQFDYQDAVSRGIEIGRAHV